MAPRAAGPSHTSATAGAPAFDFLAALFELTSAIPEAQSVNALTPHAAVSAEPGTGKGGAVQCDANGESTPETPAAVPPGKAHLIPAAQLMALQQSAPVPRAQAGDVASAVKPGLVSVALPVKNLPAAKTTQQDETGVPGQDSSDRLPAGAMLPAMAIESSLTAARTQAPVAVSAADVAAPRVITAAPTAGLQPQSKAWRAGAMAPAALLPATPERVAFVADISEAALDSELPTIPGKRDASAVLGSSGKSSGEPIAEPVLQTALPGPRATVIAEGAVSLPDQPAAQAQEALGNDVTPSHQPATVHALVQPSKHAEQKPAAEHAAERAAIQLGTPAAAPHAVAVGRPGDPTTMRETKMTNAEMPAPSNPAAAMLPEVRPQAPAREFVLQIPAKDRPVQVHLVERNGAVRVTVRASDPDVISSLRGNLGELVRTITEKGLQIEAWTPPESYPSGGVAQTPQHFGAGANESHPDRQSSGPFWQQQDQQQQQGQARERWLEELERRLNKE